jgi:hypothetical protein
MPRFALHSQKSYMLRYCRKPSDMTFRTYVTRMCEMNDYLEHFPPKFSEAQKFDEMQLIDILSFGMPPQWKLKLNTDYGIVDHESMTLEWLMDFGERQELQESYTKSGTNNSAISRTIPRKAGSTYKKEYVPGSLTKTGYTYPKKSTSTTKTDKKWCPYHRTNSHDMNDCVVVKKLAESASQSRDSKSSFSPTKIDKSGYKQFLVFQKWLENKAPKMMIMEAETEETALEEIQEEEVLDENIEEGEEIDLDNLSMGDMQDMD